MDKCRYCELKGNVYKCRESECGHHDNWYSKKLAEELENSIHELEKLKSVSVAVMEENRVDMSIDKYTTDMMKKFLNLID